MQEDDNNPEEKFVKLSKAILKAIASSREIKNLLNDLNDDEELPLEKTNLIFMMNIKTLHSLYSDDSCFESLEKEMPNHPKEMRYLVDGRKMSKDEIGFNEYFSKVFDESDWLKKIGIRFDRG